MKEKEKHLKGGLRLETIKKCPECNNFILIEVDGIVKSLDLKKWR